jgi:hypothetical protein
MDGGATDSIGQKSLSSVPDSFALVPVHALPARSVAAVEGVQIIVAVPPAVVVPPLAVPSVIVIVEPAITIVEPVNVRFAPA